MTTMEHARRPWWREPVLLSVLVAVLAMGCGGPMPATVKGRITIDGEPLPEGPNYSGEVVFYPTGGGAPAYGQFGDGGSYTLQTGTTSGLALGDYKVTVRLVEMAPEPPGGYQNAPAQKLISPPRYSDLEQTDLAVTVVDGANTVDLPLTTKP